jgi:hypothetical protein
MFKVYAKETNYKGCKLVDLQFNYNEELINMIKSPLDNLDI